MSNRADEKRAKLRTLTGSDHDNINDLTLEWLQLQAGVTANNITDAWKQYSDTLVTKANINDGWVAWLGGLLHVGALPDRWKSFWGS